MKIMKKAMAFFLCVVMTMAMGISAFAADATYTITGPSDGHTYKVYQIFTGDLSGSTLSNVKWGENGTGTKGESVPDATLDTIKALANNTQATADTVATYVNFNSTAVATLTNADRTAEVAPGYYLIKDEGATTGDTASYSTYIVSVVKDLTVSPKKDTPTFEKKIKDTNDSTGVTTEWQDSADYDIGDAVPFQLKGTVPKNYGDYTHYYFEFSDQMEKSLTFDKSSVVVKVDGTVIDSDYTVSGGTTITSDDSYNGGTKFNVVFNDLKDIASVHAGSVITVEYNATLNSNAVLGSTGNVNEAKLIYSNDPNNKGKGKPENPGETPWDNVIVFTYKVVVNKVDQDKQPLTGAEFTLYKKVSGKDNVVIAAVTATSGTEFTFKGLDDGDYVLKETKTPAGYSTAADIKFTVDATHKITWEGEQRTEILTKLDGGDAFTGDVATGALTTEVVNKSGTTLPSTGGMGTTLFYVVGGLMMAGAAVLLVTKKRMA